MILGIDPGITGALALLDGDEVVSVWDMPDMPKTSGKGRQVNAHSLADNVSEAISISEGSCKAVVEKVSAMPGQGVTSMFSFGKSAGVIEGVLAALNVPFDMVSPHAWKKRAALTGKEKDASRTLAIQKFPGIASELSRKKDVGRADAILIAKYGMQ